MSPDRIRATLQNVADGRIGVESALAELAKLPFENIEFARLDHHRRIRTGFPEAVWGANKTAEHIAKIVERFAAQEELCLVTKVSAELSEDVLARLDSTSLQKTSYEALPQLLVCGSALSPRGRGRVAVVTAGTSDIPVAEEGARTAELLGMDVERVNDVGVAGLQRIIAVRDQLESCEVVVVVAGMEGALPAVVKGLISRPVIAVPTSVGTGAAQAGLTAMLSMLTACAPGMTVVNIDNGFGAGYAAATINLDRSRIRT
ncbi:MAG: nickel pincer cofactor biosynthesis protein LarB [Myxococcales bacterium]|nr:nickel pincer cofactor biosynthesis protein LarB [Myxococcales bacterium]